jgi:hypothetical protein
MVCLPLQFIALTQRTSAAIVADSQNNPEFGLIEISLEALFFE